MNELNLSDGAKLQGKNNKVPGNAGKTASGKAESKIDHKAGVSEELGHPLIGLKKGTDLQGKNNKVAATQSKVGYQIGQ